MSKIQLLEERYAYHGSESSACTGKLAALRFPFAACPPNEIELSTTGASTSISSSSKSDILLVV
jgi:hypothetical protein